MKRVPRTPHELGMVALLAQLRRNAGRGMVVGLLALPLLAVHAPRRSDWIIGATLAVTAAIQTGLAIYKAAHIGRLVDAERTTPSRATGAVDVVRGLSSGALAAIALSVTGIVLAASGLANLWPLPRASSILDARPWPQVLLIGLLLAGIGGLGITLATSRTLTRQTGLYAGNVAFARDGKLMAMELSPAVIHLKEVSTSRTVAQLEDPFGDRSNVICFTHDGAKLIVLSTYASAIHVWDLRALRSSLKAMGLDWDWPEFPTK